MRKWICRQKERGREQRDERWNTVMGEREGNRDRKE
jgi:hypothetical protein